MTPLQALQFIIKQFDHAQFQMSLVQADDLTKKINAAAGIIQFALPKEDVVPPAASETPTSKGKKLKK